MNFDMITNMIDIVQIAKALSDPIRYQIMLSLTQHAREEFPLHQENCCGGVCNCDIMAKFGLIQSRVSYHMKELVEAGLVVEVPRGRWKYYFVNTETLREFIAQLGREFGV